MPYEKQAFSFHSNKEVMIDIRYTYRNYVKIMKHDVDDRPVTG